MAKAPAAEATRRRTLEWLARERMPVQGFHFPFPGHAMVEDVGDAAMLVIGNESMSGQTIVVDPANVMH